MKTKYFKFDGGENLVDHMLDISAGELIRSLNFERGHGGGYRRVDGYERLDGQPKPSEVDKTLYLDLDSWWEAVGEARELIQPVPGVGVVRGVFAFLDDVYAFRDHATETRCPLYKATSSGWDEILPAEVVEFDNGTTEINAGDNISGVSASGTVYRVVVQTGTWSSGNAKGVIVFENGGLSNSFSSGENLIVSAATVAVATSDSYSFSLNRDGHVETIEHNFYGSTDTNAVYGVNGTGKAFCFDGTLIYPITTGSPEDKPRHISSFKSHLFLSFENGSVQHSSLGVPDSFDGMFGASELGVGSDITGFGDVPGDTLAIFSTDKVSLLYGTSSSDWNIKLFSSDAGAIEWTIQTIDTPYFLGQRGVKQLNTTTDYGDFEMFTLSRKIKPSIDEMIDDFLCSIRVKNKNQYRLFATGGRIKTFSFDNGKVQSITSSVYTDTMSCAGSFDTSYGELLLGGGTDGYVYELDKGNSFDGDDILSIMEPAFYHYGSPERLKRFYKVTLIVESEAIAPISFVPQFSSEDPYYPSATEAEISITGGASLWNEIAWNDFVWDSKALSRAFAHISGIGTDFCLNIRANGHNVEPFTIKGATTHYITKGYVK